MTVRVGGEELRESSAAPMEDQSSTTRVEDLVTADPSVSEALE